MKKKDERKQYSSSAFFASARNIRADDTQGRKLYNPGFRALGVGREVDATIHSSAPYPSFPFQSLFPHNSCSRNREASLKPIHTQCG